MAEEMSPKPPSSDSFLICWVLTSRLVSQCCNNLSALPAITSDDWSPADSLLTPGHCRHYREEGEEEGGVGGGGGNTLENIWSRDLVKCWWWLILRWRGCWWKINCKLSSIYLSNMMIILLIRGLTTRKTLLNSAQAASDNRNTSKYNPAPSLWEDYFLWHRARACSQLAGS